MREPALVPELYCADFGTSLKFYREVLGFAVRYQRPEERFAYLEREGAALMLEQTAQPERLFLAGSLEHPFGRGLNLQIMVSDAEALYRTVLAAGAPLLLVLEERWYRRGDQELGQRQFVVTDPDGYVLRFAQPIGIKPVTGS